MRFKDWYGAAEGAYLRLSGATRRVVVAGLSMGGSLACRLAADHPEIAGLVLINPFIEPPAESFREILRATLAAGTEIAPAVGSDIAKPAISELSYPGSPLAAALSLFEGLDDLVADLDRISCPVMLFSSRQDHVVPVTTGDFLMERLKVPVRRTWLEHSYHVATLDYDAEIIESSAVAFAREVLDGVAGPESTPAARSGAVMESHEGLAVERSAVRERRVEAPAARITIEEVAHVARLARLSLSNSELEQFTGQLAAVLDHAADMDRVDISAVAPTSRPLPVQNVMRDDNPHSSLERDEVLSQAPRVENDRFLVPRILSEGQ